MCSDNKIPVVDVTNIKYHDLHEHLIASMTELKELELMRLGERIQFTPNGRVFEFPLPSLTLPAVRERVGTPLSKLIEEFLTHSGGTGKPKTVNDKIAAYNYLISIAGKEFYVEDLTRDHFVKIRKLLSAYPKNANKINALKNLSLADRVEYAKRHDLPCMKKANANKIIAWLKRLMGYAVATGKISQNPCLELEFHISQAEREEGQWQPFNIGQLNRLFSSPAFSLDYPSGAAMYWVPLIALFHGFRMEEILLLTTNEIKRAEDNKTLYFDLTNFTTDELKNSNARRRVPFHRELFLLGFDEYLADCKKYKVTRLFPELQRAKGADDSYRKIFSQKFSRYLSAQGIKTKRVVFHSFRKNFSVACTNGGVPVDIENALAGWSLVGGQGGTYKKPRDISPIKLKSMIDCVEYTGLKLSHLYK
jgi:integrase